MKVFAAYKCSLCGKILKYGDTKEVPKEKLPELCAEVVKNQFWQNHPLFHKVLMQIPHECADGSCGMAYFAGFLREE